MTGHPRFVAPNATADRSHLEHHGAPQVELLFAIVDWWISRKRQRSGRTGVHAPRNERYSTVRFRLRSKDRSFICTTR
jgi:hypothetical protein